MRRIAVAFLAGAATAVFAAVCVAIADLYLSGHGYAGLTRERLTWPALGVHLSIGDLILLGATLLSATVAWRRGGR